MNTEYYFDPRVAEAYDKDIETAGAVVLDDIPFYVDLARETAAAGQRVLELGCGTGRVAIPIAQAGVEVCGLDNSPAMLAVAKHKAAAAGLGNVSWSVGDMASFKLEGSFGLVIIPFRSFLLLLTVEQQKSCLASVRDHLVEGGRLALNIFNPGIPYIADWLGAKRGMWQRHHEEQRRELWSTREYHPATQQLDEVRAEVQLDDAGAIISRVERNLRLRWVYRLRWSTCWRFRALKSKPSTVGSTARNSATRATTWSSSRARPDSKTWVCLHSVLRTLDALAL